MSLISPSNLQAICDNVARTLIDLNSLYVVDPTWAGPSVYIVTQGQVGASNSLAARISALNDLAQEASLAPDGLLAAQNVVAYMAIENTQFYVLMRTFMAALERHTGGLTNYLVANSIQVHPEFANCFNFTAAIAPAFGYGLPFKPIPASSVFTPVQTILCSLTVTGAATRTFVAGTAINSNTYAPVTSILLRNTANTSTTGISTVFSITYTNGAGQTATTTAQLGRALATNEALTVPITCFAVTNVTIVSGGANGDTFDLEAEPIRSPAY